MNGLPSFANPANLERSPEVDELAMPAEASSLDFLRAVYRSPSQPMTRRMRAAQIAVEYEHPRLAVTAMVDGRAIGAALERALARSGKVIEHEPPKDAAKPTPP